MSPALLTPLAPYFDQQIQTGVYWDAKIPFQINPPKFSWTSNNSTGVGTHAHTEELIYINSPCGRFLNYPYVKKRS